MRPDFQAHSDCAYSPVAVYYEDGDCLEYVRRDEPSVYRRIDSLLTLVLSMHSRELVGFQLKGFKHFYLNYIKGKLESNSESFLQLTKILEEVVKSFGDRVFDEDARLSAYIKARDIAEEDEVRLNEFPNVAC